MDESKKMSLIEDIKTQYNLNSNISINEDLLDIIIDDYVEIACNNSNRKATDTKIIPYVKRAVIMAYQRLGAESVTSSGEGSQSYSFIDIEEKLAKDIQAIRIPL